MIAEAHKPGVSSELIQNSKRVSWMVWQEKKLLVLVLLALVALSSMLPFFRSFSLGLLINELVRVTGGEQSISRLSLFAVLFIAPVILLPILYTLQSYIQRLFWFFLEEKFQILIIRKKGELDIAIHENPKHNDLFRRVEENGPWRIQNFVDRQFYLLQNLIEVAVASVILASAQWWVFLIMFLGTLPELIIEARYGRDVWGIFNSRVEIKRRFWELRKHFERVSSITELKLFQNVGHFLSIIRDLFIQFQTEVKESERKKLWRSMSFLILSQGANAFAILYFVFAVIRGDILIGTLTFLLASVADLRQSLSSFFTNIGRHYQDSLFVSDTFTLLDLPAAIQKPHWGIILDRNQTPKVTFENVSFAYPDTDRVILKDISFVIQPGEKLALVGLNGAGKTTLIKLLCRFYDPTTGRIFIDGTDLREIDLESWYGHLGVLFQEYNQYHFLVKEAIGVGKTSIGLLEERVKEAARSSESDAFIEQWEKGYEQMLGREFAGGVEPSIGQWQKLALARTFYRDPRILILDEPTSSIDADAEEKIFERLERLPSDRTVILISHRFSTVRRAGTIAVIEDGAIRELGSHEELLHRDGTYARLFRLQAKGYV